MKKVVTFSLIVPSEVEFNHWALGEVLRLGFENFAVLAIGSNKQTRLEVEVVDGYQNPTFVCNAKEIKDEIETDGSVSICVGNLRMPTE